MILFYYIIVNQNIGIEMSKLFIKSLTVSPALDEEEVNYTMHSVLKDEKDNFHDGIIATNSYKSKLFGKAYVVELNKIKHEEFKKHIVEINNTNQKIHDSRFFYLKLLEKFKIIDEEYLEDLLAIDLTVPVFSIFMGNKNHALLCKDEYVFFEDIGKILHGLKIEFNVYTYKFFITIFDYDGLEVIQLLNNAKYLGKMDNIESILKKLMTDKLAQKYTKELGYKVTEEDIEERIDDFNALIEMRRI